MDNALVDADDDRQAGKPKLDSGGKQTDPALFDVHAEHISAEQLYVKCGGRGLKMGLKCPLNMWTSFKSIAP